MNMKHEFPETADGNVVYVRRVDLTDLPEDVRSQVPDADALAARWAGTGRTTAPVNTGYGLREGAHVDPDGNLLRFGSPLPSAR